MIDEPYESGEIRDIVVIALLNIDFPGKDKIVDDMVVKLTHKKTIREYHPVPNKTYKSTISKLERQNAIFKYKIITKDEQIFLLSTGLQTSRTENLSLRNMVQSIFSGVHKTMELSDQMTKNHSRQQIDLTKKEMEKQNAMEQLQIQQTANERYKKLEEKTAGKAPSEIAQEYKREMNKSDEEEHGLIKNIKHVKKGEVDTGKEDE